MNGNGLAIPNRFGSWAGNRKRELEMIKASHLVGRAVIDIEAAARLGKMKEIIVQRDGERVAGFVVVHGETIVGTGGTRLTIPASAVHSIGPDAITLRGTAMRDRTPDLETLPRMSDIVGRKMLTRNGRLLGVIDDMLINGADGTIIGFVVGEGVRNKLESIFNPQRPKIHGYVRADADLQVGNELIVVPDDALIEGEPGVHDRDHKAAMPKADQAESHGWGQRDSEESTGSSIWARRTPAEIRLKSETARPVENYRAGEEARVETSQPDRESESVLSVRPERPHQDAKNP